MQRTLTEDYIPDFQTGFAPRIARRRDKIEIARAVLRWFYQDIGVDPTEADRALS